ncbi:MAG TPA: chemotaxis protein CheB, partial [Burkholderiaceae bacterium]|nr:chemotaxis protein CheB [Burkholderiaceae bacterium]
MCVVGIGASADGLDAITEFLQAMPPNSGLAFVIVQHLSPTQKSLAVELFAKRTDMAVVPAEDGLPLAPNRVYIIPANSYANVENGTLRLIEPKAPRGQRLPIDDFFSSVAADQHERAIGIVLSGTGADGTLGLKQIIAHGGIVLVQDPGTAQFDGMPRSAIATGLATHVLPVKSMPDVLIAYAKHPYAGGGGFILDRYAPASVLINRKFEVLYFCGATDRYLAQPRGAPTNDLLSLAREGLRGHLRNALRRAESSGETVLVSDVRVRRGKNFEPMQISVTPAPTSDAEGRPMLVVFQQEPAAPAARKGKKASEPELVRQLEEELRATKDDLQTSIERLQTSNEELRVANEEVVSINEELQSVNEELESSKEELQSLNEELNTVNQQLQNKLSELETANNDLRNLLASSDIATIWLDRDLHIKWFTPAARPLLNLLATDTGRPISDLGSPLAGESLLADARSVLEWLTPVQAELKTENDRWYVRRTLPYRTDADRIDGVIATFAEITDTRRAAEAALEASKAMSEALERRVTERNRELQAMATELSLAEDRERREIARDLHDDLGNTLNVAKLKLETAAAPGSTETQRRDALDKAAELVTEASRRIRTLVSQISPPILEEAGLIPALQWLADEMKKDYGLSVELVNEDMDIDLDQGTRSIVFRAIRELLINAAKHAKVDSARTEARLENGHLVVAVSDRGQGFAEVPTK